MPLVNRATCEHFIQNGSDKEFLLPLLFPQDESVQDETAQDGTLQEETSPDVPIGMLSLWQLLHSSDKDLGVQFFGGTGQSANFIPQSDDESGYSINNLLGFGAQGLVYDVNESLNVVVKSPFVGKLHTSRMS